MLMYTDDQNYFLCVIKTKMVRFWKKIKKSCVHLAKNFFGHQEYSGKSQAQFSSSSAFSYCGIL